MRDALRVPAGPDRRRFRERGHMHYGCLGYPGAGQGCEDSDASASGLCAWLGTSE